MGGNGSFLSGITNFESGRMYKTVSSIGDNIKADRLQSRKRWRKGILRDLRGRRGYPICLRES